MTPDHHAQPLPQTRWDRLCAAAFLLRCALDALLDLTHRPRKEHSWP